MACSSEPASPPKASFSLWSNKEGFELSLRPAVQLKSGANGGKFKTGRCQARRYLELLCHIDKKRVQDFRSELCYEMKTRPELSRFLLVLVGL